MTIRRLTLAACACAALLAASPAWAQTPSTTRPSLPNMPSMTGGSGGMSMPSAGTAMKSAMPSMGSLLNINTASASQLDSLPQIGKVRSEAIVKNRPYKSTDELVSKKVLTKGIYDKIKGLITAG